MNSVACSRRLALGLTLGALGLLGIVPGLGGFPGGPIVGAVRWRAVLARGQLALVTGALSLCLDGTGQLVARELRCHVVSDDDRLPAFAVGCPERPRLLEVGCVKSDLAELAAEHPLQRR